MIAAEAGKALGAVAVGDGPVRFPVPTPNVTLDGQLGQLQANCSHSSRACHRASSLRQNITIISADSEQNPSGCKRKGDDHVPKLLMLVDTGWHWCDCG